MTLLRHLGREQTLEVGSRTWRLARFDRAVWAEWLAWARPLIPHPLDVIKDHVKDLPAEAAAALVEKAADESLVHLQPSSRPVQMLLYSSEGLTQLAYLLARPHQPDVTFDDAFDIAMELEAGDLRAVLAAAEGTLPEAARPFLDLWQRLLAVDTGIHETPPGQRETGLAETGPDPGARVPPAPVGAGAADHP